jgi:hypothetical protein
MKKQPIPKDSKQFLPARHYFFLNPYQDCAFTRCPRCNKKTKVRKYPLVIHIEPEQILNLNKTCKYCTKCDLIIARQSDIEALMTTCFEKHRPSIIGNDYLVIGTLDRSDWKESLANSVTSDLLENVHPFKDMLNFEPLPSWYPE